MKKYSLSVLLILCVFTIAGATANKAFKLGRTSSLIHLADGTGPIQTCRPGTNCPPDTQLRELADGTGPIQTCRPGTNCPPDDQFWFRTSDTAGGTPELYAA